MKFFLAILLAGSLVFAQQGLTQKDKKFAVHVKQLWAKANKDNYRTLFKDLSAQCEKYLADNPNTVIKPGILGYLFEMKAVISNNSSEITGAANELLKYDKTLKTTLRVSQVLIERKINDKKGVEVLKGILPKIKKGKQYYDVRLLLAAGEMHLGDYSSALRFLHEAVKSDSARIDGYKGLRDVMKASGKVDDLEKVEREIHKLDKDPNINVNLSTLTLNDIYNKKISISDFKGAMVVLVFFRFECPYCKKDMPVLRNLIDKYPDIKFIFINLNENIHDIKTKFLQQAEFAFLREQRIASFTDIFDKILDITITPQTLIVDKNSVVKYDYRGYLDNFGEKFEADIKALR